MYCFKEHEHPLAFWETVDHQYNVDAATPYQVVYQLQLGRGSSPLYNSYDPHFIPVRDTFSGRLPNNLTVDSTGANDVIPTQLYYFQALQYEYTLMIDDHDQDQLTDWQDAIETLISSFNTQAVYIKISQYSLDSTYKDLIDAITTDLALYISAILFIFLYWVVAVGRCHPVYCRMPLGFAMVISFLLSLGMSIALPNYVGVTFVSSTALQALMTAVVTILYSSLLVKATDMSKKPSIDDISPVERFAHSYKYAGVSLFKTFLIGVCSFGVAARSDIPAIRSFCCTGACAIGFVFWNSLLFFGGCLAVDARRLYKEQRDCCGLCLCNEKSALYCKRKCVVDAVEEKAVSRLEMLIVHYVGRLQSSYWSRFVAIIYYVLVIAVGIAAFFRVRSEFRTDWLLGTRSTELQDAIDVKNDYFGDRGWLFGMYITEVDFTLPETQLSLIQLSSALHSCEGCDSPWIKPNSVFSFYDSLLAWVRSGECVDGLNQDQVHLNSNGVMESYQFNTCLKQWLQTPQGSFFTNDVVFDGTGTLIMARIIGRLLHLNSESDAIQAKIDLTDIGDDFGPGVTFPYNGNFPYYEQFQALQPQAMFFAYLLFIFSFGWHLLTGAFPLTALLCAVNIFAIYLGFAATMWALDIAFNAVSVLHAYMCGLLGSEFSTHIIHVYITQPGTAAQRIEHVYRYVGAALPHFFISVLVAIVVFFTPTSTYIFSVYGKLVRST